MEVCLLGSVAFGATVWLWLLKFLLSTLAFVMLYISKGILETNIMHEIASPSCLESAQVQKRFPVRVSLTGSSHQTRQMAKRGPRLCKALTVLNIVQQGNPEGNAVACQACHSDKSSLLARLCLTGPAVPIVHCRPENLGVCAD